VITNSTTAINRITITRINQPTMSIVPILNPGTCIAIVALTCMNAGFPKLPSHSESFELGHDDRDVGQLDLSLSLSRLARHELADALEYGFLHGQDLAVDVSPVQRLFKGSGGGVALSVHAQ